MANVKYRGSVNLSLAPEVFHALTKESLASRQPMTTIVEDALRVEFAARASERKLIERLRKSK